MHYRSFAPLFNSYAWSEIEQRIQNITPVRVEEALSSRGRRTLDDFMALVSPAAAPFLDLMEHESARLTRTRFGRTIQMYIPLYLSNECTNICTYCGFSVTNKIPRLTLTAEQALEEARVIKELGFDHVLLVTGEAPRSVGMRYFTEMLTVLRGLFSHLSLEVQPLEEEEYRILAGLGIHTVLVYQETYHRERYGVHHPRGRKSDFDYRLLTPDRLGGAEVHKIGLGTLIGLEEWRTDAWFVALHLSYLRRRYWKTKFSISFPRLRPAEGVADKGEGISESELRQLICAYRLFDENVELSLSTRERAAFRDEALEIGITSMSAGSKTDPGGYASTSRALKQFETDDTRTPQEVASAIRARGYDVVWKDWDNAFLESNSGGDSVGSAGV